ncbi:putative glutathione peroxidase, Thioredoxin-like superfamily [Helianthus annuus]|nr:putative glutathione peroxidase, Thioredoxin-like superfamily [Helianthus annuus]
MGAAPSVPENSIHEFTVKDAKGKDVDLSIYKGKVVLIVNVASKWLFLFLCLVFWVFFFFFWDLGLCNVLKTGF